MIEKTTETPTGLTQSVLRALRILQCFTDESPELRMTDISQALDLTPSLVSRLLNTLEYEGFVVQDPATGHYRLGGSILTLASVMLNHDQIRMEALTEMQTVSGVVKLGVNLAVLDNDSIFYLAHVDRPEVPRPYTLIGRRNPLHATGMGKVLLTHLPPDDRDTLVDDLYLNAYTEHTLADTDALRAALTEIERQGWGTELEELALGRACIAGPIRDRSGGVVAALSFSGPLSRFRWEDRRDELIRTIIETCDRISIRLGYITAPGML